MSVTSRNLMTLGEGRHLIESNLYLDVRGKTLSRSFLFRYTINGKRRDYVLGKPPIMTITMAKAKASKMKAKIMAGIDPLEERNEERTKNQQATLTVKQYFEYIYPRILSVRQYKNDETSSRFVARFTKYVLPIIGSRNIADIKVPDVLRVLDKIWKTKNTTARYVRSYIEIIFNYAIRDGVYNGLNPAMWKGCLDIYLPSPKKVHEVTHRPAPTIEQLQSDLMTYVSPNGYCELGWAIIFGALTAGRLQEWGKARWEEVDFEDRVFSVPPIRRKDGQKMPFRIPLTDQMIWILKHQIPEESGPVFKSKYRGESVHIQSLSNFICLKKKGYCVHGFRSVFRDWCAETMVDFAVAEKCLCHQVGNATTVAYQRSDMLEQRRGVMQRWSDLILPMSVLEEFAEEEKRCGSNILMFREAWSNNMLVALRRKRQSKTE